MGLLRWNKEFALEQAAEDAELLQELIDIFKTSFASDLDRLSTGLQSGDAAACASAAHSIKGAAASLGMDGITEIVKAIENDSKSGSTAVAGKSLPELAKMLTEVQSL